MARRYKQVGPTMMGEFMPAVSIFGRRRKTAVLCLFATTLLIAAPRTLLAAPDEPQLVSSTARDLWKQGSNQLLAGDFDNALRTIEQVQKIEPGHPQVSSAITWLRDAKTLTANREKYREAIYDYLVNNEKMLRVLKSLLRHEYLAMLAAHT